METIIQIAVPSPLYTPFDYLPPTDVTTVPVGARVRVPFGRGDQGRVGVVLGQGTRAEDGRVLKTILEVLDPRPLLGADELELLAWAAQYYRHPIGEVVLSVLPARLREGKPPAEGTLHGWRITAEGRAAAPKRAPRQQEVLALLRERPAGVGREELDTRLEDCGSALRSLEQKGWVERCPIEAGAAAGVAETPPPLNPAQAQAVAAVTAQGGAFVPFLLDGVTGSGKTEVYLRLTAAALAQGRQVLVLVPEIGLTPQLVRRFRRRLATPIAVLHSGLADLEREAAWHLARHGRAGVVIGTRSAIFTPMPRLGLILIDEEHDLSFKQQEGFRYSARDLALVRAQRRGCPVVLGSATPSLESLYNAQRGRYRHLILPERAGGAVAPRLELLDIRSARLEAGVSPALFKRIDQALAEGGQVLLFLNRRGYAPVITCHDCGWVAGCRHCDARLTLHLQDQRLWCHHCGAQQARPPQCPHCGKRDLRPLGQGTERVEELLAAKFPDLGVVRIDRDSTRRKGSLERLLGEIRRGEHRLLLGTQMLAKGHHFPEVTLAAILDADYGLYGSDYRAAERMAQLIVQVAGRAGRAERPGRVAIQTRHPDHPLLNLLIHQGYHPFAAAALAERREAQLPPYSFQALLRSESAEAATALEFLKEAAVLAKEAGLPGVEALGPIPAPMERRAGRFRALLLLQALRRGELQELLGALLPQLLRLPAGRKARWSIDVDPQETL